MARLLIKPRGMQVWEQESGRQFVDVVRERIEGRRQKRDTAAALGLPLSTYCRWEEFVLSSMARIEVHLVSH